MTSDASDDGSAAGAPPLPAAAAGFQHTEWSAGQGTAAPALAKTVPAAAASAAWQQDPGSGLPPGTRLGELEITAQLGEGGFGIVYLCTDHALQRRVALKEYMPSQLCGRGGDSRVQVKSERHRSTFEAGRKSFINEARLLASFDHPSLVKVYRFWEANGTAYMVMPFYEGKTLRDSLRAMREAPDEAWLRALLGPLTEALAVIHAERCYHRDIAPDNVMMLAAVNPAGKPGPRPLLLDFGAARRVIGDMTQALTVFLKPGYAPIEQYAEIPGMKQGPWTDVYALAAVVYFAILGKTPAPSVGRLVNDNHVPLAQAAAGRYSDRFLRAIDRALAVRPEQRTPGIAELRQDLGLPPASVDAQVTQPFVSAAATSVPAVVPATALLTGSLPRSGFAPPPPPTAPAQPVDGAAASVAPAAAAKLRRALPGLAIGVGLLVAAGVAGRLLWPPSALPSAPPSVSPSVPPSERSSAPAGGAAGVAAVAVPATPPLPASAAAAALPGFDPSQEFAKVVQAQSAGFSVQLQTNRSSYRIGRDELRFTIRSDRAGHVHVFLYGADQVLLQLYPNARRPALKIGPGQALQLPQLPQVLTTTAPAGATDLLAIVSSQPRSHRLLQPRADGDYSVYPTGAQAAALAVAAAGPGPVMAGRAVCPTSGVCNDDYGAAMVRVQVVP